MKAPRGCSPSDGGTLQRQVIPMDLDVYWCDGSVRERWKQDVPSTITRSINGLDSQNRSRTKDLVISIINNQHPLKRRTNKRGLERMTSKDCCPGVVGTVRAVRALLEREPLKPTATQRIGTRALGDSVSPKPVHSIKALPHRMVDITSEEALSTTRYVHIFAFDLVRAVRYAVNSVAKESSLTQWSGASCICTLNRLGSPGEYN